jgi:methyl-accepting chemotaxis protein
MISTRARRATRIIIGTTIAAILAATFVVGQIRFGGPMHRAALLQDELLADILPPPCFVVEPYLHTTLMLTDPAHMAAPIKALAQEEADFAKRRAYWQQAALPPAMRPAVDAVLEAEVAFWKTVDDAYLPAARRGDLAAMRAIHDGALTGAYRRQHDRVDELVALSNTYRARMLSQGYTHVALSLGIVALLALSLLGMVAWMARALRRDVVAPLVETADAIMDMARGDNARLLDGADRQDEIGQIVRAMEVFREATTAREEDRRVQAHVVTALSGGLATIAAKDLEQHMTEPFPPGFEELRLNYNTAIVAMAEALRAVRVGAAQVSRAIAEIRSGSEDLAQRNERQASSIAATAQALDQVTRSIGDTADRASHAQVAVDQAREEAEAGGAVVTRAIEGMAAIEDSSARIGQIIGVIDGIAFQTNLLALNAGVEAARAGDAGRGFAVVASEVRALAQRSADAARDIKQIVGESGTQVSQGVALVGETGSRLAALATRVSGIGTLVGTMADAALAQADQLRAVNAAMGEMDRMTQQNAAMVEQSSAATRSLATEAEALARLSAQFRTRDSGLRPAHVAAPGTLRRQSMLEPEQPGPRLALASN